MRRQRTGGYTVRLDRRLRAGMAGLPDAFLARHRAYLADLQLADGGFPGRDDGVDLYYTHFALQSLDILPGAEPIGPMEKAVSCVHAAAAVVADVIDCYCALRSLDILAGRGLGDGPDGVREHALDVLRRHRADGGGYAAAPGQPSSVYLTFLAGICYELIDAELPERKTDVAFVREAQRPDGGFGDAPGKATGGSGGANPTAAAIGFLLEFDPSPAELIAPARSFLAGLQCPDGGFGAHPQVPVSDLLSTFTALFTLSELEALSEVRLADAARFARRLSCPEGGFRGTEVQEEPDAEYTFYGLGSLAVLGGEVRGRCCPGGGCCG